jgi:endoglucanase
LLSWADGHGVSYLAWSWIASGNCAGEPALISNYDGTPSGYGVGIRDHLLSLPH